MKLTRFPLPPHRLHFALAAVLAICLPGLRLASHAQVVSPNNTDQVIQRGQDFRVHQTTTPTTDPTTGTVVQCTNIYQELGNGICVQNADSSWSDASDVLEVTATGAKASHGCFPAVFAADVTSPNPITLFPPSAGPTAQPAISLSPIGLFYYDPSGAGRSPKSASSSPAKANFQGTEPCEVLLLKGLDQFPFPTKRTAFEMLHGNNVIVYPDVIPGVADIMVVWTHSGVEDSVIVKSLPDPPGIVRTVQRVPSPILGDLRWTTAQRTAACPAPFRPNGQYTYLRWILDACRRSIPRWPGAFASSGPVRPNPFG